jgi:N-hydroxyarylamine O-acetyltransferase
MKLNHYLQRIGYSGPLGVNIETLHALHRAHLFAIPYENLDIHLGRPLTLDMEHIYHKLVEQRRGGWCYEMNGLFAWALRAIGFEVTLLGSSVGEPAQGGLDGDLDHLILLVQLDQPWLVDVGFGNAFLEPLPLVEGAIQQDWMNFRLEQTEEKWCFHSHLYGGRGYGFTLLPREFHGFAPRCHTLQTSPESGFVRATVCHRFIENRIVSLRGALLKAYGADGMQEEEITTPSRYRQVIEQTFGLDGALADTLWAQVWEGHERWKREQGPP